MIINCSVCVDGVGSDGNSCNVCGGDNVLNLTDANFVQLVGRWKIHGMVWNEILTKLETLQADVTVIKAKTDNLPNDTAAWLTTLRDKIDAIKAVVDGL